MEFCEKLMRLRKTHHMTQDDLAQAIGVSRQAVYKWECGQSYPEAMKLVALKELFGISIDNLLDPNYEVETPFRMRQRKAREVKVTEEVTPLTEAPVADAAPVVEAEPELPTAHAEEIVEIEDNAVKPPKEAEELPTPSPEVAREEPAKAPAQETLAPPSQKEEKKGFLSRLFGRR